MGAIAIEAHVCMCLVAVTETQLFVVSITDHLLHQFPWLFLRLRLFPIHKNHCKRYEVKRMSGWLARHANQRDLPR
jgi:hypothetical protein